MSNQGNTNNQQPITQEPTQPEILETKCQKCGDNLAFYSSPWEDCYCLTCEAPRDDETGACFGRGCGNCSNCFGE